MENCLLNRDVLTLEKKKKRKNYDTARNAFGLTLTLNKKKIIKRVFFFFFWCINVKLFIIYYFNIKISLLYLIIIYVFLA